MKYKVMGLKTMKKNFLLVFLFSFSMLGCAQTSVFSQAQIKINDIDLLVEFADTKKLRQQGLMYRKSMCEHCGMLFKYDKARQASMWMKNTFIALDIAFIKGDGTIAEIKQLIPQDLTSVKSSNSVLYALEMNQGWFKKNKVQAGDKVEFITSK